MENEVWYKEGLRFGCTECGKCCTGGPGVVWISEEEIEQIARHFNCSLDEVSAKYLRKIEGRWALKELPRRNWDCIFLEGKRCQIYSIRPKQCQTFPWWRDNLATPAAWNEAAKSCEGIRDDAPLVPYEEIECQLSRNETKN